MKSFVLAPIFLGLAVVAVACSDDDTKTPTNNGTNDAGSETPDDGTPDAGADTGSVTPTTVNECTDADFDAVASFPAGGDFTKFPGADISFPTGPAATQYGNRCVKVKVGDVVSFAGSFTDHPLAPSGGTTPSPITSTSTGTTTSFTMTTAGTFGFHCTAHPTTMFGAIRVVP